MSRSRLAGPVALALALGSGCSTEDSTQVEDSALENAALEGEPAPGQEPVLALVPPTVDEDDSLAAVDLSTTRVHVQEVGNRAGDVIIVLHGGPGDDFRYVLPLAGRAEEKSLADDHLLVFWDQRGTGQSRRHGRGELTLEDHARDLDELAAHYSPNLPVSLLGHSWGGTYATLFLDRRPERVRAAALLEPAPLSSALRGEDGVEERRQLLEQVAGPFLGDGTNLNAEAHARADQALLDLVRQLTNGDVPVARMGALSIRELAFGELQRAFDFTTALDRVRFEVLFIAGTESATLGPALQERQRAFFPNSRLEPIEGADHNGLLLARVDAVIPLLVDYFAVAR
jgi:proline iminopeptidase